MSKKAKIILSLVIVALLAVIAVLLVVLLKPNDKKKENENTDPVVEVEKFTIKFDSDGGSDVESITFEKGESMALPECKKEGYTFIGWYDGDAEYKDTKEIEKDITLTAKWEKVKEPDKPVEKEVTMKVIFDSKGGSKVNSMTFKCTNNVAIIKNLPKPTKDFYVFLSWEDKNGKSILDGAKMTCGGDLKLYAVWEYDGPVANPDPEPEPTPTPVKEKTYKCPEGFELKDGDRCVKLANPEKYCENNWKEVNGECVNPASPNTKGTRVCPSKTYGGWTGTGTYYEVGRGYCGYEELPSYTGSSQNCQNAGGTLAPNNHCYKHIEATYTTQCASGEKLFAAQVIAPGNGGGCYQVAAMKKKCPDGYTSYSVYGECAIVQAAVYE